MEKIGHSTGEEMFNPISPDDYGRLISPKQKIHLYNEQDLARFITKSKHMKH